MPGWLLKSRAIYTSLTHCRYGCCAKVSTRSWESGKGIANCASCNDKFTLTNRKHHCRNCGQIFCGKCSAKKAKTTTSKDKVRVCDPCHAEIAPGAK